MTFRGRILLAGIVASGIFLIAGQILEDVQKVEEREEILELAVRGQYPVRTAQVTVYANISLESRELIAFRNRFVPRVHAARAALIAGTDHVPGINGQSWVDRRLSRLYACRGSELFPLPQLASETSAHSVFQELHVKLRFYRTPIPIQAYHGPNGRPDIEMTFRTSPEHDLCIGYDFDSPGVTVWTSSLPTDPQSWYVSGRILSLVNLRNAQVFVEAFPLGTRSYAPTVEPRVPLKVKDFGLQIGELDTFWIPSDDMKEQTGENGSTLYEYRFPGSIDEILRLSRR